MLQIVSANEPNKKGTLFAISVPIHGRLLFLWLVIVEET